MNVPKARNINLSDPAHIECPYTLYRELHAQGRLGIDQDIGTAVFGYHELVAMAKDTAVYSSSITQDGQGPRHMGVGEEPVQADVEEIFEDAHPMVNALFTADPPVHTRHRRLLGKALTPNRVRALEPHIRGIANDLIDGFVARGEVDFLSEFAVPLIATSNSADSSSADEVTSRSRKYPVFRSSCRVRPIRRRLTGSPGSRGTSLSTSSPSRKAKSWVTSPSR